MAIRPGDKRMHDQLEQFLVVGKERKFFVGEQRLELQDELEKWLPAFQGALNPAALTD